MADDIWARIRIPEAALGIHAVIDAFDDSCGPNTDDFEVVEPDTVQANGDVPSGEFAPLEKVLHELGIAFDRSNEATCGRDGVQVSYRPDPDGGAAEEREILVTQDGEPAVTLADLRGLAERSGGMMHIDQIEAAFGPPAVSVAEWAKEHHEHLARLAAEDPATHPEQG